MIVQFVFRRLMFAAAAMAAVLSLPAASIDKVLVRQQWPWSTEVKVEYRLQDVTTPVDIVVECFDGALALSQSAVEKSIVGKTHALSAEDNGIGFFYIDPAKLFGGDKVSVPKFTVKLSLSSCDSKILEPLYKIIDLETKEVTTLSRADFYNDRGVKYGDWVESFAAIGSSPVTDEPYTTSLEDVFIWTGVTNNIAYKTTKLVMRRIPAKGKTFVMGSNPNDYTVLSSDNFQINVTLTNDYYLGVFEVTKRQSELILGKASTSLEAAEMVAPYIGDKRHVSYDALRGLPSEWEGWPGNVYAVASGCVIDKMRKMLPGMLFDLPTEAQWEFACRAGTVTQNYSGVPTTSEANTAADLAVLGKYGASGMVEVGSFRPNAFGLYDVIGNVGEAVRDLYDPNEYIISADKKYVVPMSGDQIEPMGWNDGGAVLAAGATCMMMYRGGTAERDYKYNRCSDRRQWYAIDSTWSNRFGYRLWLMAD